MQTQWQTARITNLAFSSEGWLQRVLIAIRVEAAISGRALQDGNKKYGRSSRTAILLDLAPPRRPVLEVGIRRVVDWPPLLTRQTEDVMV